MRRASEKPPYLSLIILGLVLALVAAIVYRFLHEEGVYVGTTRLGAEFSRLGHVPDLSFEAAGGKTMRLSQFRGQPVILNLWATWCAPCVEELPSLDRVQRDFPAVKVIALSLDRSGLDAIRTFFADQKIQSLAVYNDRRMRSLSEIGVEGLPLTILIDPAGNEIASIAGSYDWDGRAGRSVVAAMARMGRAPAHNNHPLPARFRPVPGPILVEHVFPR